LALKEKLRDRTSNLGKEYLKLLNDKIRAGEKRSAPEKKQASMAGALSMSTKPGLLPMVPSFVPVWDLK